MNKIKQLFTRKQRNILNIYFTAGYPQREDTGTIIRALAAAGVDLIEVGMPYSDPLADGPTIQESGGQAIKNGMTLPVLFEQLAEVRQTTQVPLVLMGYFNQVLQYGFDQFLADAQAVGIDGLILPDLPLYEYETFYRKKVEATGISMSFLITPQTSLERIHQVDELSDGFIYMVSNAAITGAKSGISEQQIAYFERINALELRNPRLIGFGISNQETFDTACQYANGAIIGSAFIRALAKGTSVSETVQQFVHAIRPAEQTLPV
ncbi:MAG: tryptophan synthase subunit alpha [Bacteroidota bacterium]